MGPCTSEMYVFEGYRGLSLRNFTFLRVRLGLMAWNRTFMRYREHWAFGLHLLLLLTMLSHLSFLQVENAIQTSPCGEKTAPCILIICFLLFFFLCWPLGPYFLRGRGTLCFPTPYFCCGATCRCQNLHTFSRTPIPLHRQWKILCSLPVIKSPLPPLTPLLPTVNFFVFSPSNKVFTPPSTHPPPTGSYYYYFFARPPSNKVFTPPSTTPSHRQWYFFAFFQ